MEKRYAPVTALHMYSPHDITNWIIKKTKKKNSFIYRNMSRHEITFSLGIELKASWQWLSSSTELKWFTMTPPPPTSSYVLSPEIETQFLHLFCKTTKDFIVFHCTVVSNVCNFVSCIQFISFVYVCSFQKDVNRTCNCMFGSYHNKTALIVCIHLWRAMQLGTLSGEKKL